MNFSVHLLECTCPRALYSPKTFAGRCRNYQTFTSLLVLLILQQRTSGCFVTSFKSLGCNPLHTRHHPACTSTIKSLCGILKFPCASSYPSEEASSAPAARDTTSSKWSIDVIWGGERRGVSVKDPTECKIEPIASCPWDFGVSRIPL